MTSKSAKNTLQTGIQVKALWKARLESQMGRLTLEPQPSPYVFLSFDRPCALKQLQSVCQLLVKVLPERHPYPLLFEHFLTFLHALPSSKNLLQQVFFEYHLLHALGYGLNLSRCVVTGRSDNLTHVSPKSGCAVSKESAAPYQDKLLPLPAFLCDPALQRAESKSPSPEEIEDGLRLTGFFIQKCLLAN
jgi:DNA repair protein RecO (recombination protein O)